MGIHSLHAIISGYIWIRKEKKCVARWEILCRRLSESSAEWFAVPVPALETFSLNATQLEGKNTYFIGDCAVTRIARVWLLISWIILNFYATITQLASNQKSEMSIDCFVNIIQLVQKVSLQRIQKSLIICLQDQFDVLLSMKTFFALFKLWTPFCGYPSWKKNTTLARIVQVSCEEQISRKFLARQ